MASPEKKDMGGIIVLMLILVVGLALTPTIVDLIQTAVAQTHDEFNMSGAALAIINLVPLFWVIMIIGVVLSGVIVWLK